MLGEGATLSKASSHFGTVQLASKWEEIELAFWCVLFRTEHQLHDLDFAVYDYTPVTSLRSDHMRRDAISTAVPP